MAKVAFGEQRPSDVGADKVAAIGSQVSAAAERAAAVKEDVLLTKQDCVHHPNEAAGALLTEFKIWLDRKCFAKGAAVQVQQCHDLPLRLQVEVRH